MTRPMPIVCIPVYGQFDLAIDCLRAVARTSPPDARVIVIDDASRHALTDVVPSELMADTRITFLRNEVNIGFVGTANRAFGLRAGHDVVLLNSDVLVPPRWLERLMDAAASSPGIATVSSIANEASILTPIVDGRVVEIRRADLDIINERLGSLPPIDPPESPVAVGHCLYITTDALEKVGHFDTIFSPGYGEEVDFSLRCSALGFRHVVAPNLCVFHVGAASFGQEARSRKARAAVLLGQRHPKYDLLIREYLGRGEPLETLFLRVRAAVRGFIDVFVEESLAERVTVDNTLGEHLSIRTRKTVGRLYALPGGRRRFRRDVLQVVDAEPSRRRHEGRFDCLITDDASVAADPSVWSPIAHRCYHFRDVFGDAGLTARDGEGLSGGASFSVTAAVLRTVGQGPQVVVPKPEGCVGRLLRSNAVFRIRRSRLGLSLIPRESLRAEVLRRLLHPPWH
jgi:GT2 family glycosyltransferase